MDLHYICTQIWASSIVGYWALLYSGLNGGERGGVGDAYQTRPVKPDGEEFLPS